MNAKVMGKKFLFGCWALLCVTVCSMYLKYDGEVYLKLIGAITGLFIVGQTIVDSIKKPKEGV